MQALLSLSRAIDRLNAFVGKYSIWLIFASTFISAANAIVRKVFDTSSNAFLEVQWYLFAWSFLVAAGYTLYFGCDTAFGFLCLIFKHITPDHSSVSRAARYAALYYVERIAEIAFDQFKVYQRELFVLIDSAVSDECGHNDIYVC